MLAGAASQAADQAEIRDLDVAADQKQILRLDIQMLKSVLDIQQVERLGGLA